MERARSAVAGRRLTAWVLTVAGLPLATIVATRFRDSVDVSTVLLVALAMVLLIAVLGGRFVGAVAAVAASQLANWFFVPPLHRFTIAEERHLVALAVFVAVAIVVGWLVDTAAHRAAEAAQARREAEAFARGAASLAGQSHALEQLLEHIRASFALDSVAIRRLDAGEWTAIAVAGRPGGVAAVSMPLRTPGEGQEHLLEVFGRRPTGDEERVLRVLADQLAVALHAERLAAEAAAAARLADVDAVRTALLRAVSHDLRTPLASIKAMISGLRDPAVTWQPGQIADALATVEEETDRLNRVVGNLLDASRLQIGAMAIDLQPVQLADTVSSALDELNVPSGAVDVAVPAELPPVTADPVLLERSVVNVVSNALRFAPHGSRVRIEASWRGGFGELRVIDHGPGVAEADRVKVLAPFQRLGDSRSDGVGLGLSIAQGFVEAMKGSLRLETTPGGGLTVTIAVPR